MEVPLGSTHRRPIPEYPICGGSFSQGSLHRGISCEKYNLGRLVKCNHLKTLEEDKNDESEQNESGNETSNDKHRNAICNRLKSKINDKTAALVGMVREKISGSSFSPKYVDILVLVTSFAELWELISDVLNEEYAAIKFVCPQKLLEHFSEYVLMLEQAEKKLRVDINLFVELLKLREDICNIMKQIFFVEYPIKIHKQPRRKPKYTSSPYTPYDVEWLTYSFKSGETLQGWVYESRVNQWVAMNDRMCITQIALFDDYFDFSDYESEDENDSNKSKKCSSSHASPAEKEMDLFEEARKRELQYNYDILSRRSANDPILSDTDCTRSFLDIRGALRRKKSNMFRELRTLASNDEKRLLYLQTIRILTIVEINLLVLLRVYAPLVDARFGMYGARLPQEVADIADFLVSRLSDDNVPLAGEVLELVISLRTSVKQTTKRFYLEELSQLEDVFQEEVNMGAIDISPTESSVTSEFGIHWNFIIFNLKLETFEAERLAKERHRAMRYRSFAVTPEIPLLKVNKLNIPGMLFLNFAAVRTDYIVSKLSAEQRSEWMGMQSFKTEYPKHVISLIKKVIRGLVFTNFGSLPKYTRDALAVGFCYSIIDNVATNELDSEKKFVNEAKARRRVRCAAIRLRSIFEEVVRKKVDLMIDYEDQISSITEKLIKEYDREETENVSDVFIPSAKLHIVATNFLIYLGWCAKIKTSRD